MDKISIANFVFNLHGPDKIIAFAKERMAKHAIPSYKFLDSFRGKIQGNIYCSISSSNNIKIDEQNVYIDFDLNSANMENFLVSVLPYISFNLGLNNQFLLHSSAVKKNGKGIIFIGQSGSGKTTLALEMISNQSYEYISGDLSVIEANEKPLITAGTTEVVIKKAMAKHYKSEQLIPLGSSHLFFKNPPKQAVLPTEISAIYLPKVDDSGRNVTIGQLSAHKSKIFLYEQLSTYIRGSNILLNPQSPIYVPSFDNTEIFSNRVKTIENIVSEVPIYYIEGDYRKVAERIHDKS